MFKHSFYVFDIETEAGDEEHIRALAKPFVKPQPLGAFDPSKVRLGNLKKQDLIDAKIADEREKHQAAVANYEADCEKAEQEHWSGVIRDAALNPVLGRIVVIGVKSAGGKEKFIDGDEADVLSAWWSRYDELVSTGARFIGCNIHDFDLPFLCRRSWINGIEIPETVTDGRYWSNCFIDVRKRWLLGQRYTECESSLNHMARALGVGEKMPGEIGAHFGRYWRGTEEDRELAKQYLQRDLDLTLGIARRLGVIRERAVAV